MTFYVRLRISKKRETQPSVREILLVFLTGILDTKPKQTNTKSDSLLLCFLFFFFLKKKEKQSSECVCERERELELRAMEVGSEMRQSRFKRICVFCGSSQGKKSSYQDSAIELGKELVYIYIHCFLCTYYGFHCGMLGLSLMPLLGFC